MNFSHKKIIVIAGLLVLAGVLSVTGRVAMSDETGDVMSVKTQTDYEEDFGPAQRIIWQFTVRKTHFDHSIHTRDQGLECDSCHDELFEMEVDSVKDNEDFNMAGLAEGKYCGACHDGDTAFDANSNCEMCHVEPAKPVIFTHPVKAVIFEHTVHSEQGLSCEECHKDKSIFKMEIGFDEVKEDFTMANIYCDVSERKYCGVCHDGETAFASTTRCTACHIGVKGLDRLMGGGSKKDSHGGGH